MGIIFHTLLSFVDYHHIVAAVIWEYKTGEITCFFKYAEKTYYTFVSKLIVLPMIFVNKIHSIIPP